METKQKLHLFTTMISLIPYLIIIGALVFIDFNLRNKILFAILLIIPMLHRDIKDGTFTLNQSIENNNS